MANRSTKKIHKNSKTKTVKAKKSVELKGGEILRDKIMFIILFVFSILLMLSNFGLGGGMGTILRGIQLGSFGTVGYLFPMVVLLIGIILVSNKGSIRSVLESLAIIVLMIAVSSILHIFMDDTPFSLDAIREAYVTQNAGGLFGSLFGGALKSVITTIGAFIVLCIITVAVLMYVSDFFVPVKKTKGKKAHKPSETNRVQANAKKGVRKNTGAKENKKRQKPKEEIYIKEEIEPKEESEEVEKPRRNIDFDAITINIADDTYNPNEEDYVYEPYTLSEEPLGPEEYYGQNEFDLQDDIIIRKEADNITSIAPRERKRNKGIPSVRGRRGSRDKAAKKNITKVQNLSDIIKKKPEDIDEDILDKLNSILYDDSVENPESDLESNFGEELEVTANGMMNEGLVNEELNEGRFNTPTAGARTIENDNVLLSSKTASYLEDKEYNELITDYDYEDNEETHTNNIGKKESVKPHFENITTSSGKIIERNSDSAYRIKAYEPKKLQTEEHKKPLTARRDITKSTKQYVYPPTNLLNLPPETSSKSDEEFRSTAAKLQETLHNFGIEVQLSNISIGPTVTRYEILPEPGVKVSKIVGLTDDIKLNLAASDIRIEAPIPGKSAVGIEVPNKENTIVSLRELFESEEFINTKAKLNFALGKDIAGKPIVSDIATMPHLLIAGATGAGKSVCINTLIMSVLYKYTPQEVRLIMVDPKVVELSVYNGIPHLLIPVVTDPKKAAGALNWAVKEMTERYNKFAKYGVRNLKGYNDKLSAIEPDFEKLPQILIIIDELADLMMVAQNEVEDAICRLAQLARACGIHLVIATQRPSVNVITGLIKANIPSRIAFAVSSGIDSRTILDTVGAEKLLGKGDMLFSPQSLPKPIRVQGAFVSDTEVQNVVDFLVEQGLDIGFDEGAINNLEEDTTENSVAAVSDFDELFVQVGRFIIDSQKASIGNLQRVFRIGFNRAARIMDQLFEAGVVGKEQGTKPRQVLMNSEEFEDYINIVGIAR